MEMHWTVLVYLLLFAFIVGALVGGYYLHRSETRR